MLLNRLLVDPKWREKCLTENAARLARVLELRKLIDEPLVDKLPFLKGLAFLLEQLAMGCREMTKPFNGTNLAIIEEVSILSMIMQLISDRLIEYNCVPCPANNFTG